MIQKLFIYSLCTLTLCGSIQTEETKSELFKELKLIYSDTFDGELNTKWWQKRTKNWKLQNGHLVGAPDYATKEQAMKALKRDHHLGLGPVIRLDHLPSQFVCEFRFQYTGQAITTSRPKLDIGHHINNLFFKENGYRLVLSEKKAFENKDSGFKLNQWNTLRIEFMQDKLILELNGQRQSIVDKQVSLKDRSEFTFKALDGGSLLIDDIKLWEGM